VTEALDRLRRRLAKESKLVVAFSGGVDSALLATVAHQMLGDGALAVTALSASLPEAERTAAQTFAQERGLRHLQVHTDELSRPDYVANGANRCFHCKSALFDTLEPLAALLDARVAVGTNLDDLSDHRPGQGAAVARGVLVPMVDARLTKADVRAASAALGLSTADKPAAACLASRVAYGDPVTVEVLNRIETAEGALHELGLRRCRVRAHAGGTVARIELPEADLRTAVDQREAITASVHGAGFVFCALDLAGLRSGSMNALLPLTPVPDR
jgi:pyridinium-3,5-biscarboxylic acid mononucleotide sulfurtransferase